MQAFFTQGIYISTSGPTNLEGCRGRVIVGFKTTYAISVYHH